MITIKHILAIISVTLGAGIIAIWFIKEFPQGFIIYLVLVGIAAWYYVKWEEKKKRELEKKRQNASPQKDPFSRDP